MSPSAADSAGSLPSSPGVAAGAGRGAPARNGVGCGGAAGGAATASAILAGCALGGGQRRVHVVLGIGPGIGRFQVDDVAQEDLAFVEFVAPDDDGLEGQRAFAQPGDHRLAAGLDALGDGDFALARQQLDRAHLAQIHAHRIVGALARLGLLGLGDGLCGDFDEVGIRLVVGLLLGFLFVVVGVVGLDTLMPMSLKHRQDVFDLFREVASSEGSTSLS